MQLFPLSWNTYDSYAETLLKHGEKQDAVKMYQKSIELNPDNENVKKVLGQLLRYRFVHRVKKPIAFL